MRDIFDIDSMQFGFMPSCGTTGPIFIACQFQGKYLAKDKKL